MHLCLVQSLRRFYLYKRLFTGCPLGLHQNNNLHNFTRTDLESRLIIGQDEQCIFKQYQFCDGAWVAPNGKMTLFPKDECAGIMISGFRA
jgi:hypothetical protein